MSKGEDLQQLLALVADAVKRDAPEALEDHLRRLHPAVIAGLIAALPRRERGWLWQRLPRERHGEILAEASDAVRGSLLRGMAPEDLAAATVEVDVDDAADILQDLPGPLAEEVLRAMTDQDRARLEFLLEYPEDSAGGLMNTDVLTVRADVTLETVLRYLRARGEIPQKTNRLMVVDRDNRYRGMLRLAALLINEPHTLVADLMEDEIAPIEADTQVHDVAKLFEQRGLISAPVVDAAGHLLGRITVDDVVHVIREEGDHSLMRRAGLDEDDDTFASVSTTVRRRTPWLGINLATALLASWVIGQFEVVLQQVVALAILMPVVASMGGIAGSQTLTIVIRAMALGHLGRENVRALLGKECLAGMVSSVFWSALVCLIAVLWFGDLRLGFVIAAALFITIAVAAFAGTVIPIVLRRLRIDPALAGGVVLTTVTDVVGFMAFLGLATWFLLTPA